MYDDLRAERAARYPDALLEHAIQAPSSYTNDFRLLAAEVLHLQGEVREARAWAEKTVALVAAERILTCAFCGTAYADGTPPTGSEVLSEHIRTCEKHPMRALEAELARLKNELAWMRRRT